MSTIMYGSTSFGLASINNQRVAFESVSHGKLKPNYINFKYYCYVHYILCSDCNTHGYAHCSNYYSSYIR